MSGTAYLDDRGVIEISGEDARELLQRLLTNDVSALATGEARYAALLTPQGKIVADFFVVAKDAATFLLDCPRALAADLAKKLTLYRLRARVKITDRSDELGVAAQWPSRPDTGGVIFRDPRRENLGFRVIGDRDRLAALGSADDYRAHRILAGVPEGGIDFPYGDTFPHEANLDRLHGLDFAKGCYVGQEVVSRVEHRGTARKRIVTVAFDGEPPPSGTEIQAGDAALGTMGSGTRGHGLALVRTDRAAEAVAAGRVPTADGKPVTIALP